MSAFSPVLRRQTLMLAALFVASVLAIALFANLTSYHHAARWDLTESSRFTLDSRTVRALELLAKKLPANEPIEVTTCFDPNAATRPGESEIVTRLASRVSQLLELFADHLPQLRRNQLDPYQNRAEMEQLVRFFGGIDLADTVVVRSATRRRFIKRQQLADYDHRTRHIDRWKAESALLQAVLTVAGQGALDFRVTTGAGEPDLATGLVQLRALFEPQGVGFAAYEPGDEVPPCDLLIVAAPAGDLTATGSQAIQRYLAAGGRALVVIDPIGQARPNMAQLLAAYGVSLPGRIAVRGALRDILSVGHVGEAHPITRDLPADQPLRLRSPLMLAPAANASAELRYAPLARAEPDRWLSVADRAGLQAPTPLEAPGDLIAATSWPGTNGRVGRLVVGGSRLLLDDDELARAGVANRSFVYNAAMWLLDREDALVGQVEIHRDAAMHLDDEQHRIFGLLLVLVPTLAFCAGVFVWLLRKD